MTKRTLSREAKRLEPFLNLPRKAVTGGRSDALVAHSGLDYIVAHDTSDPTVNRNGTYYSYNFGVIGGAGVDESNNILAMLNTIGVAGGGRVVIRAADPADPIHMAKTVSIYYSNMQVVFAHGQVVTYEDKASLRIMGDYAQITRKIDGTAMKLHVDSTVVSNETVLELSATDTALMDAEATPSLRIVRVGDKIVVRGQNDASGKSIEKDTSFVKSLAKVGSYWQITCTDELDYTFKPTYPASEWPADLTTGTTIYIIEGSLLTVNTTLNITTATVADGTVFEVGDMVEIGTNQNEYAMNASAITGGGAPYKNPANLEQAQIIAISGNVLTFDHALCRVYSTTYYGFVALMVPVVNSSIEGARISYTADGIRSANALQITYAMDCHIHDCYVNGLSGSVGRKGHGLRISYSYKCTAYRNHIINAAYTGSGEGYGITIYYATLIMVDHNYISGCRHNILLQLATLAKVIANVSIDDRISGIDLHGVYSVRCSVQNNDVSRSSLNTSDSTKPGGIRIGNTSHTGGDHYNVIEGNTITGYSSTSADGIDIFAASTGNVIRNNTVIDCTVGLRFGLNSSQITPVQFIDNTLVEGNIFTRCTSRTIEIIAQPTYDNATSNGKFSQITMINNISDGNDRHFEITGVVTTLGISDVVMVGNQVINPVNTTTTYYGVSVKYTSGFVHIYDNNVSKAQRGIYLQGNGVCHVVGNKTANTVQTDPYTDGTGNTSVNYVDAMTSLSSTAFTTDVTITNTAPFIELIESDAAADNKIWKWIASGEGLYLQASNDARTVSGTAIATQRTGATIDSITLAATTINLTGVVNLTGATTYTGSTTYNGGLFITDVYTPVAGDGLQLGYDDTNNIGDIAVYDYTGSAYRKLRFNAAEFSWLVAGAEKLALDTSFNLIATGIVRAKGGVIFSDTVTTLAGGYSINYFNDASLYPLRVALPDDGSNNRHFHVGRYVSSTWTPVFDINAQTGAITFTGSLAGPSISATGASGAIGLNNRATNAASIALYSPTAGTLNIYDQVAGLDRITMDGSGHVTFANDVIISDDLEVVGDIVKGITRATHDGYASPPQMDLRTSFAGFYWTAKNSIGGTALDLVDNGLATSGCKFMGIVHHSGGGSLEVDNFLTPSTNFTKVISGNTLTIAITAGGKVTAQLTGGTGTFSLSLALIWM